VYLQTPLEIFLPFFNKKSIIEKQYNRPTNHIKKYSSKLFRFVQIYYLLKLKILAAINLKIQEYHMNKNFNLSKLILLTILNLPKT
jgi:hypothetical protein